MATGKKSHRGTANLQPWKKGQSGNPSGRPRAIKDLQELIQRHGMGIIKQLFDIAEGMPERAAGGRIVGPSHSDRVKAMTILLAYGYGKPTENVNVTGDLNLNGKIEYMTTERIRRELDEVDAELAALRPVKPTNGHNGASAN